METIWKILILSAVVSIAIFLQVLSCFAFNNNWRAAAPRRPSLPWPMTPRVPRSPCSDEWHQRAVSLISEPQADPRAHHKSVGLYFGEVATVNAVKEALAKL